jgi:serine/threonine protein kinase
MRTCVTCEKAYPDELRVCPVHGTALVAASEAELQQAEDAVADTLQARQSFASGAVASSGGGTAVAVRATPGSGPLRDSRPGRSTNPPPNDSLVGSTLNERYDVTRKIGEGGMGVVYEAKHTLIGKRVAIKVLLDKYAQKADIVARLQQEARLASSIGHEHIVDITDFGETVDGRTYVVMEFLEGESLAQLLLREGPLPPARAVTIARQVASALGAAHGKGIVHRDVKPENVFIIRRQDKDFVKVVDFGISKALKSNENEGGDSSPRLTHTGMVLGTPLYMSPEQARGEDDLDHRIDVYAVGVILYELLTGEVPFRGTNYLNVIAQVLSSTPKAPSQVRPDLMISPALEAVVMKAMTKDRGDRYASMSELDADLIRLEKGDSSVAALSNPALSGVGMRKPRSRAFVVAWVLGVIAVIGVTVAVVLPLTSGGARNGSELDPPPPETRAPVVAPPPPVVPAPPAETTIATVNITVNSEPAGAAIYWGDVWKGTTPSTIAFTRNDETIKLTLDLKGFAEAEVPFQPLKDDTVAVKLRPLKRGEAPRKKPGGPRSNAPAATPAQNEPAGNVNPDLKDSPFGRSGNKAPPKWGARPPRPWPWCSRCWSPAARTRRRSAPTSSAPRPSTATRPRSRPAPTSTSGAAASCTPTASTSSPSPSSSPSTA